MLCAEEGCLRRGQIVGFFVTLEEKLTRNHSAAATSMGSGFRGSETRSELSSSNVVPFRSPAGSAGRQRHSHDE
jgi:hypothetical protein